LLHISAQALQLCGLRTGRCGQLRQGLAQHQGFGRQRLPHGGVRCMKLAGPALEQARLAAAAAAAFLNCKPSCSSWLRRGALKEASCFCTSRDSATATRPVGSPTAAPAAPLRSSPPSAHLCIGGCGQLRLGLVQGQRHGCHCQPRGGLQCPKFAGPALGQAGLAHGGGCRVLELQALPFILVPQCGPQGGQLLLHSLRLGHNCSCTACGWGRLPPE